ncbi:hypothetical protein [Pseudoalteromonas ulvae]|uniref:hypothetical protein n=1 Tax=Pseudoalteromonas ulvae TaxID=107327 RepID=UPI00186B9419|nr:hypothetical protein [Pseudoalteromonas ulvae]
MEIVDLNFQFDKNNNRIVFNAECRLSSISQQKAVHSLLQYLSREHVSMFTLDMSVIEILDLSAELFIYQIVKLLKKNKDKFLIIRTNDQSYQQRKLIKNILKIDQNIQLEFV